MSHDHLTARPEQNHHGPEITQFLDGAVGLSYNQPGLKVSLGASDKNTEYLWTDPRISKHASIVIAATRGGNSYALLGSIIMNRRKRLATRMPQDLPPLFIGEPWALPNGGNTSAIESVLVRYRDEHNLHPGWRQAGQTSPFPGLVEQYALARQALEDQALVEGRREDGEQPPPLVMPTDLEQPLETADLNNAVTVLEAAGAEDLDERWLPAIEAVAYYRRRLINIMITHTALSGDHLAKRLERLEQEICDDGFLERLVGDVELAKQLPKQQRSLWCRIKKP